MQTIYRKLGTFNPLVFKIDLTNYGKSSDDIVDIFCSIKKTISESDDSLFLKKQSQGEITYNGKYNLLVNVEWVSEDYSLLPVGEYLLGLFIKFSGDNIADENVSQTFKVSVIQDFLIDN